MRILLAVLALAVATPPSPDSGLKIVIVQEQPEGASWRTTQYITRDKSRTEFRSLQGPRTSASGPALFGHGPPSAIILRCDLQQQFYVNLDKREYMTAPLPGGPTGGHRVAPVMIQAIPPGAPTLTIESTTTATGERKQVFGYTARHVITVRKQTPSEPDAGPSTEMKTDGWDIDHDTRVVCDPWSGPSATASEQLVIRDAHARQLQLIVKEIGAPERGFPIEVTSTHSDSPNRWMSRKVTELTSGPLDPAVFDIPSGFYHSNRWDRAMMMRAVQMWQQFQFQAWQQLELHVRHVFGWDH